MRIREMSTDVDVDSRGALKETRVRQAGLGDLNTNERQLHQGPTNDSRQI